MPGEWAWWVASSAETLHDWQYPPTPTHDLLIIIIIIIRDVPLKNKKQYFYFLFPSPPLPHFKNFPWLCSKNSCLKKQKHTKSDVWYDGEIKSPQHHDPVPHHQHEGQYPIGCAHGLVLRLRPVPRAHEAATHILPQTSPPSPSPTSTSSPSSSFTSSSWKTGAAITIVYMKYIT